MRKIYFGALMLSLGALSACATSHVMMGQPRPPISPALVQVYFHPPAAKYEEIAMLDTSSRGGFGFTAQGKTDIVINRLKEEAAKLGPMGSCCRAWGTKRAARSALGLGRPPRPATMRMAAGWASRET